GQSQHGHDEAAAGHEQQRRHQPSRSAPREEDPGAAGSDGDALPSGSPEPCRDGAREHEIRPEENPHHGEESTHGEESVARWRGRRPPAGQGLSEEWGYEEHEPGPQPIGPALEDEGGEREPRRRSEPDGESARGEGQRWRTTATG